MNRHYENGPLRILQKIILLKMFGCNSLQIKNDLLVYPSLYSKKEKEFRILYVKGSLLYVVIDVLLSLIRFQN